MRRANGATWRAESISLPIHSPMLPRDVALRPARRPARRRALTASSTQPSMRTSPSWLSATRSRRLRTPICSSELGAAAGIPCRTCHAPQCLSFCVFPAGQRVISVRSVQREGGRRPRDPQRVNHERGAAPVRARRSAADRRRSLRAGCNSTAIGRRCTLSNHSLEVSRFRWCCPGGCVRAAALPLRPDRLDRFFHGCAPHLRSLQDHLFKHARSVITSIHTRTASPVQVLRGVSNRPPLICISSYFRDVAARQLLRPHC